ncbi:MAG: glutamate 5-kinase [Candidatus Omnitrophica bacterium]|jgi:glutamate 5-kinase|nr:glutamate 5-kinase [Candidatus Omnitrophota bacterium]
MQSQKKYKRIVVKIGSSLFYSDKSKLDEKLLESVCSQVADLLKAQYEVVLVSSGAIALGMSVLGLNSRPKELAGLQAAAAIGQHELMDIYRKAFKKYSLNCAQLLLTWDDFSNRQRFLNAKNTLNTLLKLKTVPIINENDTVSTDEIKFGDNDRLSALVSILVGADLLIILSDVDGLLDGNQKVVRLVDKITAQIKSLAAPAKKKTTVGGMITKIEACRIATASGISSVIANGKAKDIISLLAADASASGTLFLPVGTCLDAKERWMAFGSKAKGKVIIDDGAKKALLAKKSLLAVGVTSTEGSFLSGEIISICDKKKIEFARGKAGVSSKELDKVLGSHFDREVVHRNNIVIL